MALVGAVAGTLALAVAARLIRVGSRTASVERGSEERRGQVLQGFELLVRWFLLCDGCAFHGDLFSLPLYRD